jgi:Flp pilus assembly CpaE family ATPase
LTVFLIEDNPEYAALVRHWLSQPDDEVEYVLNWTDSVADGRVRLARGGVSVILLDLNLTDSAGADTLAAVQSQAPKVPTIILSADNEVSMALRLIQEGADNYLVKGSCDSEMLTRAIRFAVVKHDASRQQTLEGAADRGKVIAVAGGKGGVGVTTVACALASELRCLTGEPVLLADLDLNSAAVAFLMDVKTEYSILDAVSNSERLDRDMWERIVVRSAEGLDIACSPALAGPSDQPAACAAGQISRVLAGVRPLYRWVVLDMGRLNGCDSKVLAAAEEIVVVTSTSIPALYESKRGVEAVRTAGFGGQIRVIINRNDTSDGCPQKELQSIFGVEVTAILPSCGPELQETYLQKRLSPRNSAFRKELSKLVQAVGGPAPVEMRPTFLSRAGRLIRRERPQAVTDSK